MPASHPDRVSGIGIVFRRSDFQGALPRPLRWILRPSATPPNREACACVPRPRRNLRARHRCEPRDDKEWQLQAYLPRTLMRQPSLNLASRCGERSGSKTGLSPTNRLKGLPNTLLERRTAHIEWQVQANARIFNEANDPGNQRLKFTIGTDEARLRETVLEIADQRVRVVDQQD